MIEQPQALGLISGRFRGLFRSSHHQISCYGFHGWLCFTHFFCLGPTESFPCGAPSAGPGDTVIRGTSISKHSGTSDVLAMLGRLLTNGMVASLVTIGAIAPPPRSPHKPSRLAFSEDALPEVPEETVLQYKYAPDSDGSARPPHSSARFQGSLRH